MSPPNRPCVHAALPPHLKEEIQAKEGAAGYDGEAGSISARDGLRHV